MKDAKKNANNLTIYEVELANRNCKRLMAYATARSNLAKKKKKETSK